MYRDKQSLFQTTVPCCIMNYTEYSIIVKFHYNLALFVNFDYARAKANLSILRLAFLLLIRRKSYGICIF